MIDNHKEATELIHKIEENLPLFANPMPPFISAMREKGIKLKFDHKLKIDSVLYLGDEGGIGCAIQLPNRTEEIMIVSLTHLRIKATSPLIDEIKKYQDKRIQKLSS